MDDDLPPRTAERNVLPLPSGLLDCQPAARCFSEQEVLDMLKSRAMSTSQVLEDLDKAQETLQLLRKMEEQACRKTVMNKLLSGQYFVRGRDRDGRPICWSKTARGVRGISAERYGDTYAGFFFVYIWALAHCSKSAPGVTFVFDDEGRDGLDFDVEMARVGFEIVDAISLFNPVGKVYLFGLRPSLRLLLKIGLSTNPKWASVFKMVKNRAHAFEIAAHGEDVPDYFVAGRGRAFEPTHESLGCFENLSKGNVFESICIRDLCLPDLGSGPWSPALTKSYSSEPLVLSSSGRKSSERNPLWWSYRGTKTKTGNVVS